MNVEGRAKPNSFVKSFVACCSTWTFCFRPSDETSCCSNGCHTTLEKACMWPVSFFSQGSFNPRRVRKAPTAFMSVSITLIRFLHKMQDRFILITLVISQWTIFWAIQNSLRFHNLFMTKFTCSIRSSQTTIHNYFNPFDANINSAVSQKLRNRYPWGNTTFSLVLT